MTDRGELWRILWQGALMAPLLLLLAVGSSIVWYRTGWDRSPRWQEAWRDAHTPFIAMERLVHFRWIHPDARYWVLPVRMDRGDLVVSGLPPEATYWSLTWYQGTHAHPSINSENVVLDGDGTYTIHISEQQQGPNWLPRTEDAKRAVLYLRIYEGERPAPDPLPSVEQGARVLTSGGLR